MGRSVVCLRFRRLRVVRRYAAGRRICFGDGSAVDVSLVLEVGMSEMGPPAVGYPHWPNFTKVKSPFALQFLGPELRQYRVAVAFRVDLGGPMLHQLL